jgi:hypothetical protein
MPLEVPPRTSRFASPLVAGQPAPRDFAKGLFDNDAVGQKGVVSEPDGDPILVNRRWVAALGQSRRLAFGSEPTRGESNLLSRSNQSRHFKDLLIVTIAAACRNDEP